MSLARRTFLGALLGAAVGMATSTGLGRNPEPFRHPDDRAPAPNERDIIAAFDEAWERVRYDPLPANARLWILPAAYFRVVIPAPRQGRPA